MAKKKKTPAEELQELEAELQERHERWNYIRNNGTSDPFWPDGVNMNLVRNHCVHYHRLIKELCKNHRLPLPEIYHKPVPPEMPMDFMARPRKLFTNPRPESKAVISRPIQHPVIDTRPKMQTVEKTAAEFLSHLMAIEEERLRKVTEGMAAAKLKGITPGPKRKIPQKFYEIKRNGRITKYLPGKQPGFWIYPTGHSSDG